MSATHKDVEVAIVQHGSQLRVRPTGNNGKGAPVYTALVGMWVQFPLALRTKPGDKYVTDLEDATGKGGRGFLRVPRGPTTPMPRKVTPAIAAPEAWEPEAPPAKPRELTPDEVIEGGRDVTVHPSNTARVIYHTLASTERERGSGMRQQALKHAAKIEEWPAFVREVFARLYDEDGCAPLSDEERTAWASSALGALEAQPEWSALREAASTSKTIAAKSTAELADAVGRALNLDSLKTDETTRRDPRELADEAEAVQRLMEASGASEEQVEAAAHEAAERVAAAIDARRTIDRSVEAGRPHMRTMLQRVAKDATEQAAALTALCGLGFNREGPGSVEEACPDLLREVRMDPRMLKIVQWTGRMTEAADGELAKGDGHCDVVGIVPTHDVSKLTTRTKAMLAMGGFTGLSTMRDIMEGSAQGWRQRDKNPRNKGDAWILVDRSGSMSGDPEIRARAAAVAALVSMLKQNRRVCACSFAGRGDSTVALVAPGDVKALGEAVRALCKRASDGTDVDDALRACVRKVNADPIRLREPDVVVITDGFFPAIAKDVLASLGDRRLFGVLIGVEDDGSHPEFDALWPIIGDALDEKDAATMINAMRAPRRKRKAAQVAAGVSP